jgi:hypothetical protein
MANVEIVRLPTDASPERIIRAVNTLIDALLGNDGAQIMMVGHDGTSTDPNLGTPTGTGLYQAVIRSSGTNHLQVRKSDDTADRLTVTDTATTADVLAVTTTGTYTGLQTFNGGATFAAGQTVTGNGAAQFKAPLAAVASAALTLTAAVQDVPGCSLSLTPGVWLVVGVFDFITSGAGDVGQSAVGRLATSGGAATVATVSQAILSLDTATTRVTVAQPWLVTVTATTTAKLQASKTGGGGASFANLTHTTITAVNA